MKKNKYNVSAGHLVKCKCGKIFIPTIQWVYRTDYPTRYYCSYSCWRKAGGDGSDKEFKNKPTRNMTY